MWAAFPVRAFGDPATNSVIAVPLSVAKLLVAGNRAADAVIVRRYRANADSQQFLRQRLPCVQRHYRRHSNVWESYRGVGPGFGLAVYHSYSPIGKGVAADACRPPELIFMNIAAQRGFSVKRIAILPMTEVVNIATVIHRSPFRYPGGKTWLVPRIRQWLKSLKPAPRELAEPFAGGAIVSLSALFENLVSKIVLVEKDIDVGAVWKVMLNGAGKRLANEIASFDLNPESAKNLLAATPQSDFERAFATIVRNRIQRGGIIAPGASWLNKGENNKGILSRWYPETLKKRIEAIVGKRSDMAFIQGDGIEFIRYNAYRPDTVFFIDPPYTVAGRRLYAFSDLDHRRLFKAASMIAGDFLMTYDNSEEIRNLANEFGFQTALVPMKNTHHEIMYELLVGKDLRWVSGAKSSLASSE